MSTKCTLAHSNELATDFHFYRECFDDEAVYLELRGECAKGYVASQDGVTVRIPIEIWEVIRKREEAHTLFEGFTDAQLEECRQRGIAQGYDAMSLEEYQALRDEHTARRARIERLEAEQP